MTNVEVKVWQTERLYDIYLALRSTPDHVELLRQARRAESSMTKEEIANVKERVEMTPK